MAVMGLRAWRGDQTDGRPDDRPDSRHMVLE